jgi:hypothetical protein
MKLKTVEIFHFLKPAILTFMIIGLVSSACSNDIYVSPNGNDDNPGN